MKIDSHLHFWKYNSGVNNWIDDNMQVLRNDFLPENIQPLLQQHSFDGGIAVQVNQTTEENDFMLSLAAGYSFIKGIVGWVNLCDKNAEALLEKYTDYPVIKGFRHILQAEDNAFMLQPCFLDGIRKLKRFNFTYDVLINHHQLNNAVQLCSLFPQQKFVINHFAKPLIKDKKISDWKKDMAAFSSLQNVYCKLSGFVTEAHWKQWKQDDFFPYFDVIFETFGTERILFGSDWPVCLAAADYNEVVTIAYTYIRKLSMHQQEKFWGLNAVGFYNIKLNN